MEEKLTGPRLVSYSLEKYVPGSIFFKLSHLQDDFSEMKLTNKRNSVGHELANAYDKAPLISLDKYRDPISLCEDSNPLVRSREHINFYKSMYH